MNQTADFIDAFAHEVLKLAKRRDLFRRIDEAVLRSCIMRLPHYKVAVADPDLVSKLEKSLEEWAGSTNLFVVQTIIAKVHAEAQAAAEGPPDEAPDDDSETDPDDDGNEDDEESATKLHANIGRYRELIGNYIGIDDLFGHVTQKPIVGPAYSAWARLSATTAVQLFRVRKFVMIQKRLVDDALFQLMAHLMSQPTANPILRIVFFIVWLAFTVVTVVLTAMLYILRPGRLLELIGLEEDDILITE